MSAIRVLPLLYYWIKPTLEPPYVQGLVISIICSSWGCQWEWTDSSWGPHVGRPTCHLDDGGSHWPSGRSLGRWVARPGGMTQLVGRPTDLWGPWPTTGLPVVSPLVMWSVVQSWVWLHTCLLPCGPKDPCAKCLNSWGQAYLDPRFGIDSLEYAMAHAMEGSPWWAQRSVGWPRLWGPQGSFPSSLHWTS